MKPVSDLDNYGSEEVWAYPEGSGDCEDYALEKRKRLSGAGLPPRESTPHSCSEAGR